jgi:ABC-type microcin C transport system duplicated ATPase subunit YejF
MACAKRSIPESAEMAAPLFAIRDLKVRFATAGQPREAVSGVTIEVAAGESVAIVGESGSGKSQTALAAMGLLARNGAASGSVVFEGGELLGATQSSLDKVRGSRIAMIFQEPMTSLDPLFPIGAQIAEPLAAHRGLGRRAARSRAIALLKLVGIAEPELRIRAYPHQLSGGQRQRVMIAMAIANNPALLIADEPTTALDVTVQAQILDLLRDLQQRLNMALLLITHDLGLVRRYASRVYVMRAGAIVESGEVSAVMANPKSPYTRALIDAEPAGAKNPPPPDAPGLLEARDISVAFDLPSGMFTKPRVLRAVDGVSLALRESQTLGVVGESGSGKSTLGRALLRLTPCSGALWFQGVDLQKLDQRALRPLRRQMQLVFQDPFGSLSPRMAISDIVAEGLLVHASQLSAAQRNERAAQALDEVGIDPAKRWRTPNEFSGGQRQRIAIARAMILKPKLLVLDEPTSALDRSVQKEVLALLRALQEAHRLTYIFISHDLAVVRAMADEILVMKDGRVIERGATPDIFERPQQDYTRRLIAAAMLPRTAK